jgi:diketogulonate reductase-like aldo/keto reductase
MKTHLPNFIYGTAWKQERTQELTQLAVKAGFRAIDTANQKKHYREDFVGEALKEIYKEIPRDKFWLQSKYTYVSGQDHRLPYNPDDDYSTQVKDSFQSTLKNLHTTYLDSYLLHGPQTYQALTDADWQVWKTMEDLYESGRVKSIGVSNVGLQHLEELYHNAEVTPGMVQNRCFAAQGWDQEVRGFCAEFNIVYQGFSLLTANPQVLADQRVQKIATKYAKTVPQIIFCFSKQVGILPLTGTTNETHMKQDLDSSDIELTSAEMELLETGFSQ